MNKIKFLPSYVGSKSSWLSTLSRFKNEDFVELFCGSAVLSANLARTTVLNDLDPIIYKILSEFDKLIVPEEFTKEDFMKYRKSENWWQYIYCLQKMSFSGVFRYSKNGYNVPIKKNFDTTNVYLRDEYNSSLKRWNELKPKCFNLNYLKVSQEHLVNKIVILDPPYENSQAAYNKDFNYKEYWEYVNDIKSLAKCIIIFDTVENLYHQNIGIAATRQMRVNGSKKGNTEAISIFENGSWYNDPFL